MKAFLTGMLVLLGSSGPAWARTWTSTSGKTVEADFEHLDGDRVVLKTTAGKILGIPISKLSEADQGYVRTQAEALKFLSGEALPDQGGGPSEPAPAAETPALPAEQPKPPAEQKRSPKSNEPSPKAFLKQTYQNIAPFQSDILGGFTIQSEGNIAFIGRQIGPTDKDLVVLVLDGGDESGLREVLYLYEPGKGLDKPVVVKGSNTHFPKKDGSRVVRFRVPAFTSQFGDVTVTHEWELYDGVKQRGLVYMVAKLTLKKQALTQKLTLCGFISEKMTLGPGEVDVHPYLLDPVFQVRQRWSRIYGLLQVGDLWPVAEAGMVKHVVATAFQKDGREIQSLKIPLDRAIMDQVSAEFRFTESFDRVKPGKECQVKCTADLGLLGTFEDTCAFTVKADD